MDGLKGDKRTRDLAGMQRAADSAPATVEGQAFLFINYNQAALLGHLGWGFMVDSGAGRFYFGSTDHLLRTPLWDVVSLVNYLHVPPAEHTDWWAKSGSFDDMLEEMRNGHHVRYHAYKILTVPAANPFAGVREAEATRRSGWQVLANNCLHQTYRIMRSYGAADLLPDPNVPLAHRVPRHWFDSIASTRHWL